MPRHRQLTAPSQQGFTLIELLIALLIIAVGILGHSRLQITSIQSGREARFSQVAYSAMLELSERIQAAPQAAMNGEFNFTNLSNGNAPAAINCMSAVPACSRAQFARYELSDWFSNINEVVPEPRFSVTQPETNLFRISMTWDANLTGAGAANCSADTSGQGHQCLELELWIR